MLKFFAFFILAFCLKGFCQLNLANQFISGGINDGEKFTKAYLKPIEYMLVYSGGNNISVQNFEENTFFFEANLNIVLVPNKFKSFDINNLQLENFEIVNPNFNTFAQTLLGNNNQIVIQTKSKYRIPTTSFPFYEEKPLLQFKTPKGVDLSYLSMPFLKFGYSFKNFTFILKGFPKINSSQLDSALFSYGGIIQKDFDLGEKSSFNFVFGIQNTQFKYFPNIQPNQSLLNISTSIINSNYNNQVLILNTQSIPLEIGYNYSLSNKLKFGFNSSYVFGNSKVNLKGNFPIYFSDSLNLFNVIVSEVENPLKYSQKYNHFRSNVSFGFNTKYFYSNLIYSYSEFKSINLNVGVKI